MTRKLSLVVGFFAVLFFVAPSAHALKVTVAKISGANVQVVGQGAARGANIGWEGLLVTRANSGGSFNFKTADIPATCVGYVSDGAEVVQVVVANCVPQDLLPATGQTTPYQADKNDLISGPVAVPDDGTLQTGAPLRYLDTGLTVIDLNTGLEWEKKCSCGGLHDQGIRYPWSGNGSEETIWDWLDDVNAEDGTGYAGHGDWRIPNIRELQSIADYGRSNPAIHPAFNNGTDSFTLPRLYWSSTTNGPLSTLVAWYVDFSDGSVASIDKSVAARFVRAVRAFGNDWNDKDNKDNDKDEKDSDHGDSHR